MKHLLIILFLFILTFPLVAQEAGDLYLKKVNGKYGWFENGNDKKDWKYIGEIKNGKPNGTGVLSSTFGKYFGELKNGMQHGQGTYTYKSGRKRVGEFRKGKPWIVKSYDENGKIETEWVRGRKLKKEGLPAVAQMAPLEIESPTQVAMKQEERKVRRFGLVAYNTEKEAQKIVDEMQKKIVGETTGTWDFTVVKLGKLYQVQTKYGANVTEEQKAFFFNILNFEYDGQMGNMKADTKEKGFVQIFPAKPKTKIKPEMEDVHITLEFEGEVDLGVGVELDLEVDINASNLAHEEAEKTAKLAEEEAQRLLKEHAAEEAESIAAETAQTHLKEAEQEKRLAAQEAQIVAGAAAKRAAEKVAKKNVEQAKKATAARSNPSRFKAQENIVQFETPVEIKEEKDLGLVSFVEDFTGVEKEEIPPLEEKEVSEYKSYKIGVRALSGNTSGEASTSNSSLSLIWENYGLGFNQMSFKTTSSKNNVYEMKNSSLDLSYTLEFTSTIVEDWSVTAGLGYVYEGKGSITSASTARKYETESVSGFGLFGLLGMAWEGLEGLIGVRYYSTNYTDFISTNSSEVLSLGKPYTISSAQLVFGLGYSFY
mgnify:CR=1 FL=1